VFDQSQERTDDFAFSSDAQTHTEEYMNAKISQGAIFHKINASGTSRESILPPQDREIKTGAFSLQKMQVIEDSNPGSRVMSPSTVSVRPILVQTNGVTIDGQGMSITPGGARNTNRRTRSNLKGMQPPPSGLTIKTNAYHGYNNFVSDKRPSGSQSRTNKSKSDLRRITSISPVHGVD
jgi:hypothetical protein